MLRTYLAVLNAHEAVSLRIRKFLRNDKGETNVMTNIMLLAIAALICVALYFFGGKIWDWILELWKKIRGGNAIQNP